MKEVGVEMGEQPGEQRQPKPQTEETREISEESGQEEASVPLEAPAGPALPLSYTDAVALEKATHISDSKHWFAKLIEFLWKRTDPTIDKKKK